MSTFVGVDWASKRWVVVAEVDGELEIGTQPSFQAVWDAYREADQILVDIPIGLPSTPDTYPRLCDDEARENVAPSIRRSIFDVPSRQAVQTSDYQQAHERNADAIEEDTLGPQTWGIAERIHEVDVFMRHTEPGTRVRESHPEVCFAALTADDLESSKNQDVGQQERLEIIGRHAPEYVDVFEELRAQIESTAPWKRRLGIGMLDDIVDAMVLALTARLGSNNGFEVLGSGEDNESLPMEIVCHRGL